MNAGLTRYVVTMAVLGGVGVVLFASWLVLDGTAPDLLRLAVLAGVSAASVLMPLRFYRTGGSQGFHFEGAVFVAGLLTIDPLWVPLLMTGAAAVGFMLRTQNLLKATFNTGQVAVQTTLGTLVFVLLSTGEPVTSPRTMTAVILASVMYEAVSVLAMGELFHRLDGTPRLEAARQVAPLSVVTFAGNAAYGIILATVLQVSMVVAIISGCLMLGLYVGYRGYAAAVSDQRRAESLSAMTHRLIDLPSGDDGLTDFLQAVVSLFGGLRGELVIRTADGIRHMRVDADGHETSSRPELPRSGFLAEAIARQGGLVLDDKAQDGQEVIAAAIGNEPQVRGALAITDRRGFEPWDSADATMLAAIANELAIALDNVALFHQVEEERARLEAESTKLNDILTAATDGIVSMQADGTIDSWNPGMANITGVAPEDAIGRPWYAVLRLKDGADRDLAPATDLLDSHVATNEVGPSLSFQVMRVDGEWRRLQCTISPVRGPGGDERGVVLVARDVTAEREVDELKSDFIATVSHELRTPLTPLKGFLTTLQNAGEDLSSEQAETVFRSMGSQLARLEALIADLLAVAELDRGQLDLHTGPVQLSQLVPHAVDSEAGSQRDRCTVEVADVVAQADPVAIVRIVRSLVSNALKHTEGPVQVLVGTEGEWTTISVMDEGPGIPQWDQQRIFGRFDRLGNHLQRTQGPGLGLTIARSLAQRMGGDILLDSELGTGSTFTLKVPTARPRLVTPPVMQAVE